MRTIFLSIAVMLIIASGFVFSVGAVQATAITAPSETQVASRYHQRGRTNNFFKRTSRGRKC
jgi:hypothetical protein